MSTPECDRVRKRFLALEEGALPADEARALRAHLAQCEACRQRWDAWQAQGRLLAESLGPAEAPRDLAADVMAKLRAAPSRAATAWRPVLKWALAAAAVAALVVGVATYRGRRYVRVGHVAALAGLPMAAQRGEEFPSVIHAGAAIYDGARLVTGRDESLEVRLGDGSRLVLGAGTEARLSGRGATEDCGHHLPHVCLRRGEILCTLRTTRYFRAVGTPLGSAIVSGTTFRIQYVPGVRAILTVLDGEVQFSCPHEEVRARAGSVWVVDSAGQLRQVESAADGN